MAGANPLGGAGALAVVEFLIETTTTATVILTPTDGLFNETLPAIHATGTITITAPLLNIIPDTAQLVVGDTQAFTVSGAATLPLSWGVTDPGVASIDPAGLLTATASGTTRVFVQDAASVVDTTGTIEICDFYVIAPIDTIYIGTPTPLPIQIDRDVTGMGIYGYELELSFDPTRIVATGVSTAGTVSAVWGAPVVNLQADRVLIVHAGATPLSGTLPLVYVSFKALPPLIGTSRTLSIDRAYFNEGDPCARVVDGSLGLPTAAPDTPSSRGARLGQNVPNPFNPLTTITYQLDRDGPVRVGVYNAAGERIRVLVDRSRETAGLHTVRWDGRGDDGAPVVSGVYFYRLETESGAQMRKAVLLR